MFLSPTTSVPTVARVAAACGRLHGACLDYGQRVQYSVFECDLDPAQWTALRSRLCDLIDPKTDSLRFYMLGSNWRRRVEHVGAKPAIEFEGPLIF